MTRKVYQYTWRNKWITAGATSIDEMISLMELEVDHLKDMRDNGVRLSNPEPSDDYAILTTEDADVAGSFGFVELDD